MLWLPIDRNLDSSLTRQIYQQIRQKILKGELKADEKLPASRDLAANLQVSRNVILEAYEQLAAEGYVRGQQGSGTYVASGAYLEEISPKEVPLFIPSANLKENQKNLIDFRSGIPALDLSPREKWGQLFRRICSENQPNIFSYDNPEGSWKLREVLCGYLRRTRGVQCQADQLVITLGAMQGLFLVALLLLSARDEVLIEDPIQFNIQKIFSFPGSSLFPIPVDDYGIRTDLFPKDRKPALIFVTPSHQFPLGGVLPIQRRVDLIQFARKAGCYIVEDDYDSEFRYEGPPVDSLQGLDPERVIYVGTFSKILFPGLRLGYLVLPYPLVEKCRYLKLISGKHCDSLEQLTLAHFIQEGYLEKHLAKIKKAYFLRRQTLIKSLESHFSNQVTITGTSTGLHLIAHFHQVEFTKEILDRLEQGGVRVYPVELHAISSGRHPNKIILGYSHLDTKEITKGIKRMKAIL